MLMDVSAEGGQPSVVIRSPCESHNMIEQPQAMPLLVESCPTFQDAWERHLAEWGGDLLYIAAGDLADHLLERYRAGDSSSFPTLALAVEKLIEDGSPWLQEFVVIGVLEAVQNVWGNAGTNPEVFAMHLSPQGLSQWTYLNEYWSGSVMAANGTEPDARG